MSARPPVNTPGQRWRLRRDILIAAAYKRLGYPQSWLADVFDLPQSRVSAIVRKVEKHGRPEPDPDAAADDDITRRPGGSHTRSAG